MLFDQMHPSWQSWLQAQQGLLAEIEGKLDPGHCQPSFELVMRAFWHPIDEVKVVVIGQDPYPNKLHATGLAFAVPNGTSPTPPTLRNILAELFADLGVSGLNAPDLTSWASQGVMLLNRHLTTEPGKSLAHTNLGWTNFTDEVVRVISQAVSPTPIFVLWGRQAQQVKELLPSKVPVIESVHPSPLSARLGFFGSKPFSQVNTLLISRGQSPINWLHA